jgi:O-acetyl-ADP-ribose deacetylase (regulator of RNase III)
MELIFVVFAAAIVWLYWVNAAVCYVVVGGGVLGIVMAVIMSKALKARKPKVATESVNRLEVGARVVTFQSAPKGLVISQDPS